MPLEESQKAKAVAWVEKHVQAICPVCQSNQGFSIGNIIAPLMFETDRLLFDRVFPVVPVICRNCYNVRLFAAVLMGILPADVPQTNQPVQPPQ
jgi:hypothetical protein